MMSVDQAEEASKIFAGLREKHAGRKFEVKIYPNVRRLDQAQSHAGRRTLTSLDADRPSTAFRFGVT